MMVVSKGLPGIALYRDGSDTPFCRAAMGISPHEGTFSMDGTMAYVPVYGSSGVGQPGTDEHVLHFIRTADGMDTGILDTGDYKRPHGIEVGRSGTIYVTSEIAESVLLIHPEQRRIVARIPTGSPYSHMLAVTKDERKIYVSNVHSQTVSVLDIPSRALVKTVSTGSKNQRMTLSPDGRWFVTSLIDEGKIAFYRTEDDQLDFTVAVEGHPFISKFSADGTYLYNAGTRKEEILAWKIDVAHRRVLATVENLGEGIGSLCVNPFDGTVYVSAAEPSQISIIDPDSWKVIRKLQTDAVPDAIAFTTVQT